MRCCISENETISSLIEKCFEMRRRERRMKSIENETADGTGSRVASRREQNTFFPHPKNFQVCCYSERFVI